MRLAKQHPRWGVHAMSVMAMSAAQCAFAAIGDLDPSFGSAGRISIATNSGPFVFELPDGRILIAGVAIQATDAAPLFATNRYRPDGAPDPDYGVAGRVTASLPGGNNFWVLAAALQQDEKLAFVGTYWASNVGGLPYASRVDQTGTLDPAFAGGMSSAGGGTEPWYSSMVVMPSGEILAAISDWTSDRIDRYGTDGRYLGSLTGRIAPDQLALQRDGRLIVSGYHRDMQKSVVMRVDAAGRLDRTFGTDGYAAVPFDLDHVLAVDPASDRILICNRHGITRLARDGLPDSTFGASGYGYVAFGSEGLPDVRLCAGLIPMLDGGTAYIATQSDPNGGAADRVVVGGLTGYGGVDTRFGGASGAHPVELGPVSATFDYWDRPSRLAVTRDGNALLTWRNSGGSTLQLARLDLEGAASFADPPATSAPNPPQPPPDPAPAPVPEPAPKAGNHGGGGSADPGTLMLLGLALWTALQRRRGYHRGMSRRYQ